MSVLKADDIIKYYGAKDNAVSVQAHKVINLLFNSV